MKHSRNEYVIARQLQEGSHRIARSRITPAPRSAPRFNLITIFLWAIGLIFVGGLIQRAYKYFAPFM